MVTLGRDHWGEGGRESARGRDGSLRHTQRRWRERGKVDGDGPAAATEWASVVLNHDGINT
jgi:hypothetical protein